MHHVTSVRNNSSIPSLSPSHSQLFLSPSSRASSEVRRELVPLVHSRPGLSSARSSTVYTANTLFRSLAGLVVPRYYRPTHVDTFCLLMIEIEIIPARHRAEARLQHPAASCKVGLMPLSIFRPLCFSFFLPWSKHFVKRTYVGFSIRSFR